MSGDTAVPMPDRDAVQEGQILRPSQVRRAEALMTARKVLENRQALFAGSKLTSNSTIGDLTYLAEWILTGQLDFDGDEAYPDADDIAKAERQGFIDGVKASQTFVAAGGTDLDELLPTGEGFPVGAWEPGPPSYPADPDHDDVTLASFAGVINQPTIGAPDQDDRPSFRNLPPTGALAENDPR